VDVHFHPRGAAAPVTLVESCVPGRVVFFFFFASGQLWLCWDVLD
jgi:hypothetical protein